MTMGCLYASVSVATTNTIISLASGTPTKGTTGGKEEDTDSYAANIVQKTVSFRRTLDSMAQIMVAFKMNVYTFWGSITFLVNSGQF